MFLYGFLKLKFFLFLFWCKMDIDIIGKLNDWTLLTYKNLSALFFRKTEICWTKKINASYILRSSAKSCWSCVIILCPLIFCIYLSAKPYQGLWFDQTQLLLFQNMSVKIYTNFFLLSGGYNFKIMTYRMWVHILLSYSASFP